MVIKNEKGKEGDRKKMKWMKANIQISKIAKELKYSKHAIYNYLRIFIEFSTKYFINFYK